MQQMLSDPTSLAGISGLNLALVVVISILSLLTVVLLCSWCCRDVRDIDETKTLIQNPVEPTAEKEKVFQQQIRTHYVTLGDNIDTDSGLLAILFSKGVINIREKQHIEAEKVGHKRNERLLDQMLKKSELDFSKFIDALRDSNQNHIARILMKDGAALPVHINIQTQLPVDVKEIELELVRQFNEASGKLLRGNCSIDELEVLMRNLLTDVQQKKAILSKAVPEKSIVLYFFCSSSEALVNIARECQSGSLSRCIEKIVIKQVIWTSSRYQSVARGFTAGSINADLGPQLFRNAPRSITTVCFRVDDDDYKRCLGNFPGDRNNRLLESIKLVIYIQRSFRQWRSYNRSHRTENAQPAPP